MKLEIDSALLDVMLEFLPRLAGLTDTAARMFDGATSEIQATIVALQAVRFGVLRQEATREGTNGGPGAPEGQAGVSGEAA